MSEGQGGDPWREAAVVLAYELRAILLGIRSFFVVFTYGVPAGLAGAFYLWATKQVEQQMVSDNPALATLDRKALFAEMMKSEQFRQQVEPALKWFGAERLFEAALRGDVPWVLIVVLVSSTFVLPGLSLLIGYDRISEDLNTKQSRFILQRVRRGSWLAGKVLGLWISMAVLVFVTHAILIAIGAISSPAFDLQAVLVALPQLWGAMGLLLLAYSAFSILFSTLFTPPFAALAVGGIALSGLWFLSIVTPLRTVWMGTWDMALWGLDPAALGVYFAHAVLFTGMAWGVLRLRDV
jgi:hypothetical protein